MQYRERLSYADIAQRLRFKVFYEEMSASPNGAALISRRDVDAWSSAPPLWRSSG